MGFNPEYHPLTQGERDALNNVATDEVERKYLYARDLLATADAYTAAADAVGLRKDAATYLFNEGTRLRREGMAHIELADEMVRQRAAKSRGDDFWSYFPGLPRRSVIDAIRLVEMNEGEMTMSHIREVADREARDEAHGPHERHVNLMAGCYLCEVEAGSQTDRLTV